MNRSIKVVVILFVVLSLVLFGCSFAGPSGTGENSSGEQSVESGNTSNDNTSQENTHTENEGSEEKVAYTVSRVMPAIVLEDDMKSFIDAVLSIVGGDGEVIALGFDAKQAPFYTFHMTMKATLDETTFKNIVGKIKDIAPPEKVVSQYSEDYGYISVASDENYKLSFNLSYDGGSQGLTMAVSKIAEGSGINALGMNLSSLSGKWQEVDGILKSAGIDTTRPRDGKNFESLYVEFPANAGGIRISYALYLSEGDATGMLEKIHSIVGGNVMDMGGKVKTLEAEYKGMNISTTVMKAAGDKYNFALTIEF